LRWDSISSRSQLGAMFRGIHYLEFNQNLIYKYASKEIYINCLSTMLSISGVFA
jgi:hypothetical protein